jgi:cysteine desulfurase family protein (TIGR01976 family)
MALPEVAHRPGTVADIAQIRAAFPALVRTHHRLPVAYFDGPGGTQVPTPVVEAMAEYLYHHNANTHWAYPTSQETDALLAGARSAVADFLNGRPDEIAFGANMTTLTFHVSRALGRSWGPGDEIVVTELDHHANVAPWRRLAKERGVTIRSVRFNPDTGQLVWTDLEDAVGPKTRLLAIGGASNALGTVNDVARAVRLARAAGALVFMDAVHYAPHVLVDVRALGVDLLACSAYKFYGPHVGILWGRHDLIQSLDVPKLDPAPDVAPEKLETGTQNHEGIVGAAAAVDFLASLAGTEGSRRGRLEKAFAVLHARGQALVERLWEGLGSITGVRRYGPPPSEPRTPTVSFTLEGIDSTSIAQALADRGVFASNGDFYAATVIERYGRSEDGVLRAGCACYTTEEEVDRLLDGVRAVAARVAAGPR